jgi:glycine cleavage system aminomethyltransferase T
MRRVPRPTDRTPRSCSRGLLSNDLAKVDDGGAQYTAADDGEGGIVDDLIAYRLEPGCFPARRQRVQPANPTWNG